MNSVMEIGDNVMLLSGGKIAWTGPKSEIIASENQVLQDFIFASPFLKRLREAALERENEKNGQEDNSK